MAEKVPKSTRLPKDEAELVEAYADEHELTEADALRRLIRTGLEEQPDLVTRSVDSMRTVHALQIALLFMLIGLQIV
jgi:hypothetical protein